MSNGTRKIGVGGRSGQIGKKKNKVSLPKPKPRVTELDVAKKVGKILLQSSVQYPYEVTKGLLTGDMKSVKKGFTILQKMREQKGKWNKGTVKTNKVQKALKMVKG